MTTTSESFPTELRGGGRTTIGERLESIIDHSNVATLLRAIETIMREKSEHIAENWQDAALSRAWDVSASAVEQLAAKFQSTGVPGIGR